VGGRHLRGMRTVCWVRTVCWLGVLKFESAAGCGSPLSPPPTPSQIVRVSQPLHPTMPDPPAQMKDKIFAAISHELRTPLNGIIGLAEGLIAGRSGWCPAHPTRLVPISRIQYSQSLAVPTHRASRSQSQPHAHAGLT
jgi:hypothetical protein